MKQTLPKLVLLLIVVFLNATNLIAAPEDYGRDYILRGGNQFATFLMVITATGVFILFICVIVSKIYTKVKRGTDANDDKEPQYSRYGCVTCPACKGKGWVKGKEIPLAYPWSTPPSGKHECQRCKGFGRVLTPKAENIIIEIQKRVEIYHLHSYYLIKKDILERLKTKNKRRFYTELFTETLQNELIHEIGNAKDCPDCYGTGEIVDYEVVVENRYDDITKMDYNRYYKKEQCKTCSGTGYVQLNS